jgi:hypothetical protein
MTRKTKKDCNVQFEPGDTSSCIETRVKKAYCFWAQPLPPAGGPQSEPLTARQLAQFDLGSFVHSPDSHD